MMPSKHDRKRSKRARQRYNYNHPEQGSDNNEKIFDKNSDNFEGFDSKTEDFNNFSSSDKDQTENIKDKIKRAAKKARKVVLKHKSLACFAAGVGGVLLCLPILKDIINRISDNNDQKMF